MKRHLVVLALFIALSLAMTFPLVAHLGTSIRDYGDSLLNTWILAWDVRQITHGHIGHFFDANIFYPHTRTLAYSEHLFTESLAALPVALLTGNPVLAHNIVLLLGFITSAFGMYFLARYLTGKILPAIIAGVIYAFNPFMFAHIFQVQVLWAGGIPLTFLFLHRYFDHGRRRDILAFAFFFILQVLANGYYALFLSFFAALFILVKAVQKKRIFRVHFWLELVLAGVLIAAAAGPFTLQYVKIQKDMGFRRDIGASARPKSFLATSSVNRLYGRATARNLIPEGELFPGAVAFLLALTGIILEIWRKNKRDSSGPKNRGRIGFRIGSWVLSLITLGIVAVIVLILFKGGFEWDLGSLGKIRAHNPLNPLILLAAFLTAGVLWRKAWGVRLRPFSLTFLRPSIYLAFLILSFAFTFGASGPYVILHKYLPGFNGIRVPARFHVVVMFSLAVFASRGMAFLGQKFKSGKIAFATIIAVLILAEYFSCPLPLRAVPTREQMPSVYRWLGSFPPESFAVAEVPFPDADYKIGPMECPRVFFSSFHFQKLLNGYSGFFPPLYDELKLRWTRFSALENVADLKTLGIRYIIFHMELCDPKILRSVFDSLKARTAEFRFVGDFDEDYVYEILGTKMLKARPESSLVGQDRVPLSRADWKATASVNAEKASLAIDGRILTRWDSGGRQEKGQTFVLDLGRISLLSGLGLRLGSSTQDYPRAYRVELSKDGIGWNPAASSERTVLSILTFLEPKKLSLEIDFPPQEARFVRIVNEGETEILYWSIHELDVFAPAPRRRDSSTIE
jgi:hypothetical protein